MNIQFDRAVKYLETNGYKLVSMKPYIFEKDTETLVFSSQGKVIKEYTSRHKRKKGFCIECGNPIPEIRRKSGAQSCRCEKCYKEFVKTRYADKCAIIVKKETKDKIHRLGAKYRLKYPWEIIEKLLEDKGI